MTIIYKTDNIFKINKRPHADIGCLHPTHNRLRLISPFSVRSRGGRYHILDGDCAKAYHVGDKTTVANVHENNLDHHLFFYLTRLNI